MIKEPKKLDRRKFLYAGLGAAIVVVGGLAAYFATRPPERIVETVVQTQVQTQTVEKPIERVITQTIERPVEKTIVTTVAGTPTTIVRTEKVVETQVQTQTVEKTIEVVPTAPMPPKIVLEQINWDKPDWVDRLTGVEIGKIPDHWIERWPFLKTYRAEPIAAIKGYQLPEGWKKAVEGVKVIRFLNYGGIAHDPATAMGMSAFEDMTGIRVEMTEMEELTLWLKTISIMTAKSSAVHLHYINAAMLLQQAARSGWLVQSDFMWPEKVQKLYAKGLIEVFKFQGHWYSAGMMPGPKPFILFYRPSWLKKATGYSEPPRSYLEILDIGKQVAEWARKELGPGFYGLSLPGKDHRYMWGAMLGPVHSLGGSFVDKTGRINFFDPAVQKSWKLFVDYFTSGAAPPESLGWSWSESPEVFGRGKAGLVLAGSVDAVRYSNPQLSPEIQGDWAIAEPIGFDVKDPPRTGDPWIGVAGVNPYASPNEQAAAFLFADYYRSFQSQWNEMVYEGNETAALGVYDLPSAKERGLHLEMRKKWETVGVLEALPPGGDDIFVKWLAWFQSAALGKISAEEALKKAQEDADKIQA